MAEARENKGGETHASISDDLWKFGISSVEILQMGFALALIVSLSLIPSPAASAIIVVCGPPAPDGKECCPVTRQIYWKDYGQPPRPQAPDRADRSKLRAWYNKNCVGPRSPSLPAEP